MPQNQAVWEIVYELEKPYTLASFRVQYFRV